MQRRNVLELTFLPIGSSSFRLGSVDALRQQIPIPCVMGKGVSLLLLLLSSMLLLETAAAAAERARPNKSSSLGGFVWATGKDEGDLIAMVESPEEPLPVEDEIAGGFSSLEGMLQWAIGKSLTILIVVVSLVF